jgi:hypothetical protein
VDSCCNVGHAVSPSTVNSYTVASQRKQSTEKNEKKPSLLQLGFLFWWAYLDSNQEPDRYERSALTILSYTPLTWYPLPDSNRYALWRGILSPLCLPIPPSGQNTLYLVPARLGTTNSLSLLMIHSAPTLSCVLFYYSYSLACLCLFVNRRIS